VHGTVVGVLTSQLSFYVRARVCVSVYVYIYIYVSMRARVCMCERVSE
jgi:hypothetical protein